MPQKNEFKYDREAIFKDFNNGISVNQIMNKYGISRSSFWRIIRIITNTKPREYKKVNKLLTKEFLEEHYVRLKKPVYFIAKEFNIKSSNSVKMSLIKHGFKLVHDRKRKHARLRDYEGFRWRGCGEIGLKAFNIIKRGADKRNIEFNITIEYVWNLFLKQNRKCALSGVDICFNQIENGTNQQTASLDRIDSLKGYTEDNVQWVHKIVQKLKWDFPEKDFINWCSLIANNTKDKKC